MKILTVRLLAVTVQRAVNPTILLPNKEASGFYLTHPALASIIFLTSSAYLEAGNSACPRWAGCGVYFPRRDQNNPAENLTLVQVPYGLKGQSTRFFCCPAT